MFILSFLWASLCYLLLQSTSFYRRLLFGRCLEINHNLGNPTCSYIIIIKHSKDYDRGGHNNYEGKWKRDYTLGPVSVGRGIWKTFAGEKFSLGRYWLEMWIWIGRAHGLKAKDMIIVNVLWGDNPSWSEGKYELGNAGWCPPPCETTCMPPCLLHIVLFLFSSIFLWPYTHVWSQGS